MLLSTLFSDTLTLNDISEVLTVLHDVQDKWFVLGVQLKVSVASLRAIRAQFQNPGDCLLEMLTEWLSNVPSPTWQSVVDALASKPVGQTTLAGQITAKYCQQTQAAGILIFSASNTFSNVDIVPVNT